MVDINGTSKVKLSWGQIAWLVAGIITVTASYWRLDGSVNALAVVVQGQYTKEEINKMKTESENDRRDLHRKDEELEKEINRIKRKLNIED